MSDAIVDEVRKARDEYARRFNYDLQAMCADLRRQQEQSEGAVVSFPRRRVRVTVRREAAQTITAASNSETAS